MFQSALPRGERHRMEDDNVFMRKVSIRAPAWGAAEPHAAGTSSSPPFQSALPRGERPSNEV